MQLRSLRIVSVLLATGTVVAGASLSACQASCSSTDSCGTFSPVGSGGGASKDGGGTGGAAGGGTGGSGTGSTGGKTGVSGAGGAGGGDASTGSGGQTSLPDSGTPDATPPCNPAASPAEAACVIDEQYGVFVAPAPFGNDGDGVGTRLKPYATIGKALTAIAAGAPKRVYACADGGNYAESVTMGAALNGVHLYGSLRCVDFSYVAALVAKVKSPDPLAWKLDTTANITIQGFDVTAADATTLGGSSIGMLLNHSTNVVLQHVLITAGKGFAGADGVALGGQADPGAPGNDGTAAGCYDATSNPGGAAAVTQCGGAASASIGGKGGDGGEAVDSAGNGNDGLPSGANGGSGNGQKNGAWSCSFGPGLGGADVGANGTSQPAASGATTSGSLTSAGFSPADGADGLDGTVGQGGGGGGGAKAADTCGDAAKNPFGASGGGGGGGGCGGKGGASGKGGGASIALASVASSVTLDPQCVLTARGGGAGGNGAAGQGGGSGGKGGSPQSGGSGSDSCVGGYGGKGGHGGFGGGGAGGPSVAIAYTGTVPVHDGVTTHFAAQAAPGGDGSGKSLAAGAGVAGVTGDAVAF